SPAAAAPAPVAPPAARQPREVKGLRQFDARRIRQQKIAVLSVTIGPLLALALAIGLLWGHALAWTDVAVFTVMYVASILGVTVGFHRMLTHASFDTKPWVANTWAVLGSLSIEGGPIGWVADHRRHHAHSDEEGDPHSPHLEDDDTFLGMVRGLWHAHIGWMIRRTQDSDPARWAPDLLKRPGIVLIDRLFIWMVVLSFALPALIGFLLTGTAMGTFTAFLWGGPVRVLVAHHIAWSTNSICHFFGKRPYDSGDHSTNNWLLSIVSMGESWHNNHHAFPSSAVHGLERHQVDISAMVIRGMEKVGLASNVRTPSEGALERKRVRDAAAAAPSVEA
ncbi:MAG: acyl-CoA desaturase, partial [Thermoleophilia bacterium]|nr:acyl-CoA desaturase [Thermoleophilia bacterium]